MKKILTLTALFTLTCIALAAPETHILINGVYYMLNERYNTASVTWGGDKWQATTEYTGEITIPSHVEHNEISYIVNEIGPDAFYNCTNLTAVNLPSTITSIREGSFYLSGLTSLVIPSSVERIERAVFHDCIDLEEIHIPSSVKYLGNNTFTDDTKLGYVMIASYLDTLGNEAFSSGRDMHEIAVAIRKELPYQMSTKRLGICTFRLNKGYINPFRFSYGISATQWDISDYKKFAIGEILSAKQGVTLNSDLEKSINANLSTINESNDTTDILYLCDNALSQINITRIQENSILAINCAKSGVTLSAEDQAKIASCIDNIQKTSDALAVRTIRENALAIISKQKAQNEKSTYKDYILAAAQTVELSDEEQSKIDNFITCVENATSQSEIDDIYSIALAYINAIKKIKDALQGETNNSLAQIIESQMDIINSSSDPEEIKQAAKEAVNTIKSAKQVLNKALGTKQPGTVVEITSQNDNIINIYNPKKVNFKYAAE